MAEWSKAPSAKSDGKKKHRRFKSFTFHNMKGGTVFDIVDTGKDSRIKITDERGTQARLLKR